MKTFIYILFIVTILTGCFGKTSTAKQPIETDTQVLLNNNSEEKDEPKQLNKTNKQTLIDKDTEEETELVIIGGKQYKRGWEIESVYLWIDPEDPKSSNSLENIERHWNLKELTIKGKNLDKVDFSPISLLTKLVKLEIEGNITRMPDMTNLKQLREVEVSRVALESLEGINGPSIERILIESPGSNGNIILKVSDMKNLNSLKIFSFMWGKIDLSNIDRINSLEVIEFYYCEPYNINSISGLKNLKELLINLMSDNPSIEFIKNMPNLTFVVFYGNHQLHRYSYDEFNPSQVLDLTPLATLRKLQKITCKNLIIKNISALDAIELCGYIDLEGSKLFDEKEKSRHALIFESHGKE